MIDNKDYLKKAAKLNEELEDLKYRQKVLIREIKDDEEKLFLAKSEKDKRYLIDNIAVFEKILANKKMKLYQLKPEIYKKEEKYHKYLLKHNLES